MHNQNNINFSIYFKQTNRLQHEKQFKIMLNSMRKDKQKNVTESRDLSITNTIFQ